jgi:hypothetical protein
MDYIHSAPPAFKELVLSLCFGAAAYATLHFVHKAVDTVKGIVLVLLFARVTYVCWKGSGLTYADDIHPLIEHVFVLYKSFPGFEELISNTIKLFT